MQGQFGEYCLREKLPYAPENNKLIALMQSFFLNSNDFPLYISMATINSKTS
jgi:hypothetical protein